MGLIKNPQTRAPFQTAPASIRPHNVDPGDTYYMWDENFGDSNAGIVQRYGENSSYVIRKDRFFFSRMRIDDALFGSTAPNPATDCLESGENVYWYIRLWSSEQAINAETHIGIAKECFLQELQTELLPDRYRALFNATKEVCDIELGIVMVKNSSFWASDGGNDEIHIVPDALSTGLVSPIIPVGSGAYLYYLNGDTLFSMFGVRDVDVYWYDSTGVEESNAEKYHKGWFIIENPPFEFTSVKAIYNATRGRVRIFFTRSNVVTAEQ